MHYLLEALILGVVEGVTEFLPVSSTAHLILFSEILGIAQTEFHKSFEIIIQLGAILAVAALYWKTFLRWAVLKRLTVAFLPTGILGLLVYPLIKQHLIGNSTVVVTALAAGGAALILFEKFHMSVRSVGEGDVTNISYKQCLSLGLWQALAMVPGVSRSAATIVGGLVMGLKRETIVEFSFLLAVPTMLAATALDVAKNYQQFAATNILYLLVGFVVAFVTALASITWLLGYIRRHSFVNFGWYRIALAAAFTSWMLLA